MIEWRWNLRPLTVRDASARNLALSLDFSNVNVVAPQYFVPPGPFGTVCSSGATTPFAAVHAGSENWDGLRQVASQQGWPIL
jgi:hypothetical protein